MIGPESATILIGVCSLMDGLEVLEVRSLDPLCRDRLQGHDDSSSSRTAHGGLCQGFQPLSPGRADVLSGVSRRALLLLSFLFPLFEVQQKARRAARHQDVLVLLCSLLLSPVFYGNA
jgi:hypothetical protein